ncbi:hypothetical protein GOV10_02530, partial [Candidatus Woesearchaeota archaeon]|nr:hypothetical protein [Candidatus Woesearchaeota archaeon]
FRERCSIVFQNCKALEENKVCAKKIYAIYARGSEIEITDKELRPWLTRAELQDNEALVFDRSTRIVLIVKDCDDYKVVKTVFRAVCRVCGEKECGHLRKFRREQNKKDKKEKKEKNDAKFSEPEYPIQYYDDDVSYTCPGCDKKFYTSDTKPPLACPWCKCEKLK